MATLKSAFLKVLEKYLEEINIMLMDRIERKERIFLSW